ncbi:MAG: cytochrome P460 family protein [Pseudomonadota bacterium]
MHVNTLRPLLAAGLLLGIAMHPAAHADAGKAAPAPNGITLPADYADWRLVAPSYRTDKHHVRAILGNDKAIQAARSGRTKPWPDGAILAKVAWKEQAHERFPTALEAGAFSHVEIMVKDSKRFKDTDGWGYARWVGKELKPYGQDAGFVQECHGCHTPVADNDFVFTAPVALP